MVPNGWEVKHLSELASKVSDGIHKTPLYAESSGVYFINGNNLKNGSIVIQDSTNFVDENDAENHRKDLGERTILMSINGTIGNLAYYRGENVVLGKSAAYINVKNSVDLDFVYYVLSSSKTQAFYESELTGTTIRNLSIKSIKNTKVDTPPLPEQKKIAQILSTWDRAISTTEQLLANSQQQKKALMQQLLTGKKRLLDNNGVRFSGEWQQCIIEDFFDVGSSKRVLQDDWKNEGTPFYRTRELVSLSKNEPFRSEVFIADELFHELSIKYGAPKPGDFLVSGVGTLGISYQVKDGDRFYFKDGNVLWFKIKEGLFSDYFKYCFQSDFLQEQIVAQASITTVGTYTIQNAKKTKFWCPPSIAEQQKISAVLSTADQEIAALQQKLDALKQEKMALMQQLLTGKKRVIV
ncbi:type I restriction-modification enzyme, S subunit [Aeromonas caviae]|uniref:restriction endonuclease subunit S n=1 Tax=Aeromonas caviae TaxID=648 RepID=UPI0018A47AE3|nr:restriction endonuclease subunit S [Aeromonas caviae]BCM76068.1 type I restriction-modification enzyme, S subunit [Aeromonas caviae]GJC22999.1 type I restriction-modification enzyme, S subunit [Aeromonas caviae]